MSIVYRHVSSIPFLIAYTSYCDSLERASTAVGENRCESFEVAISKLLNQDVQCHEFPSSAAAVSYGTVEVESTE